MLRELLENRASGGMAAAAMSRRLGVEITRNAVIGQAFRRNIPLLGVARLPRLGKAPAKINHGPRPIRAKRSPAPLPSPKPKEGALMLQTAAITLTTPRLITIMDLRHGMCKWPIGDPRDSAFRFCGDDDAGGRGPYCVGHARLAYATPSTPAERKAAADKYQNKLAGRA